MNKSHKLFLYLRDDLMLQNDFGEIPSQVPENLVSKFWSLSRDILKINMEWIQQGLKEDNYWSNYLKNKNILLELWVKFVVEFKFKQK